VKRIRPLADRSCGAGEDLARRHVALAVAVDPQALAHIEADVGAVGLDPCVRVANALVRWMARHQQPGTPVRIR
jgi:hypothetical protein